MNEEARTLTYLVEDHLGGDTELQGLVNGVFTRAVPATASFPVVKIDVLERGDVMVIGLHRVWNDMALLIRGQAAQTSGMGAAADYAEVQTIADRLDALLHDHEEVTSTLAVHSFREESWTDETVENSKLFLHCGGIYRLRARAV